MLEKFSVPTLLVLGAVLIMGSVSLITKQSSITVSVSKPLLEAARINTKYDLNQDGKINNKDVRRVVYYITNKIPYSYNISSADFNGDKRVDITDLALIRNYLLNTVKDYKAYADLNDDGVVDYKDAKMVQSKIGQSDLYAQVATFPVSKIVTQDDVTTITWYAFDLNADGLVNKTDQSLLTKVVLGTLKCPWGNNCDLNGDGVVNVADIVTLTNFIQKYNNSTPTPLRF